MGIQILKGKVSLYCETSKRYKFREKQEEKSYKNIKLKEHENLLDMSCRVIF